MWHLVHRVSTGEHMLVNFDRIKAVKCEGGQALLVWDDDETTEVFDTFYNLATKLRLGAEASRTQD